MNEENLPKTLKALIETLDTANVLTEPLTNSIEDLLRTSAAGMNSDEASVIIRDGSEGDMRFLSAIGEVAEQLLALKIPAGKGIAGFVMSSGQPMAVADAGEERTFYAEVDKTTGYSTQTILATPLRHNGEVIGVLEYVNRRGNPPYEPFTPAEMDSAAVYAEALAALVNAYESVKIMQSLGKRILTDFDQAELQEIREWLGDLRESAEHKEMLDLALLVRAVASRGDAERQMCRELLETILRFSDSSNETSFLSY